MVEYTAVVKKEGDWWIGWIEEIPGGKLPGIHTPGTVGDLAGDASRSSGIQSAGGEGGCRSRV